MIEHRPFASLGAVSSDWLKARLHFRVGNIGRADHAPLGALHVLNDDEFAPHSGFGLHPHRNVEIVTWVRSGAITHEDDAGNQARLVAGSLQVMSAGAGVHHAERNAEAVPARLFQLWLTPRTMGGAARWAARCCSQASREGKFVTLASADPNDIGAGALPINANARVRLATLRESTRIVYPLPASTVAYLVTDHGAVNVGDVRLEAREGAVIRDESAVSLEANKDTDVLLVELTTGADAID
ncbi:pirin family protein [Paraburkholderia sp. J67]|uniref:pirin family protein n=1 Tax=Paraburkholderia sp. J67 TaxID=2805435 RepID=UPI002ABDE137|nr:pirin family protein [Paraburkholderia sp. J67]